MGKQRVAGFLLVLLLALGRGDRVAAASSLPALPGAVASGPTRLYTDPELGFEVLLPDKWQVIGHDAGPSGAGATAAGETAWREFRVPDAGTETNGESGGGVWVRVIRTAMQLDPAAGGLTSEDREALAAWLSSSYYAWHWVTQLSQAAAGTATRPTLPPSTTSGSSLLVAYGSGEGIDSAGEKLQLHLWVFAAKDYSSTELAAPLWLFVAGGPTSQVEREIGLLKAMAATFRPLAATTSSGTSADLLLPLQLPELQLSLEQPRGWEVYVGRQSAERLVQLAAADGKALVLIHLISYDALSFGERSAASGIGSGSVGEKDAVQLLGRAYLANLTVSAEEGGEGITAVDVKVAGLTGTAPARFEAIFTYDDPQVGLAAGWLLVQLISAATPDTSPTVLVLEARAVADRFDPLYPTFRAVSESIRVLP